MGRIFTGIVFQTKDLKRSSILEDKVYLMERNGFQCKMGRYRYRRCRNRHEMKRPIAKEGEQSVICQRVDLEKRRIAAGLTGTKIVSRSGDLPIWQERHRLSVKKGICTY